MSEYRFHLQRYTTGSKTTCPGCGKTKCFTKYVDDEGVIEFPDNVGICDHINSCHYHYSPSDYFHDNPGCKDIIKDHSSFPFVTKVVSKQVKQPSFIPSSIMEASLKGYEHNPLYVYLKGKYGEQVVSQAFRTYKIGTANMFGGSTVYWQIDNDGNVRTGKVMAYYCSTGKRIKGDGNAVCFVHGLRSIKDSIPDFQLKQCFFGEHLLATSPYSKVCIVESEKTAVIASICMPGHVWIASGGKDGCFRSDVVESLRGRDVILFPDLGQFDYWHDKKMPLLTSICKSVHCSDMLEKLATPEECEQGLDIADYLLKEETAHDILQKMFKINPALQLLIDKFDLELIVPP